MHHPNSATTVVSLLFGLSFSAVAAFGCGDDTAGATASDGASSGVDGGTADAGTAGMATVGASCEVTAAQWSAPDWSTTAATALALRAQLDTLTGDATMRGAETGATSVELSDLTAVWTADPGLASVASPGFAPLAEAAMAEFVDVVDAGPRALLDDEGTWMPGEAGGVWGEDSRGINEGGIEVRQLVDKGGYSGGILYAYAIGLTEGSIDAATIEAIAAAWGANAELDPDGELTDAANYAYQMGMFADMATALTNAKALTEVPDCTGERDAALAEFFDLWERSMAARLVFYGNRAEGKLLAATDDTGFADVLHDLAEGLALVAAFRGLPDPATGPLAGHGRTISDAQVDAAMAALGVELDDLGASTTGELLQSLPQLESAVAGVEAVVMEAYGVDAATIVGYAMPTPG